ncbi:diguanylate cyclase, putative [Babesia ovata]|uniref:Diguanylate cyclase, putative n=1 Tax=Babesia ovata TaxID=189622 RepID=A0A2H6KKE9_9APIC|nr:diguanylate cyclase, putative [Babesia ovata]GBE63448.1 diguanylate cyclase, putative [Babesia ovata]
MQTTKFDLIDKSIRAVEKTQKVDLKRLMELVGELAVAVGEADKVSGTLVRDYQRMIVENLESINEHVQPLATETIANELNKCTKVLPQNW